MGDRIGSGEALISDDRTARSRVAHGAEICDPDRVALLEGRISTDHFPRQQQGRIVLILGAVRLLPLAELFQHF